jgi:hypothetical protein
MSWKWPRVERTHLARLVMDHATSWLTDPRLDVNWNDLHGSANARRDLVRALYQTLVGYRVNYVPKKYDPKEEVQIVRTPDEILDGPREGTCLDLALLFCGLCLGCELVPWLVIMRGHAWVLVSLAHRLRKYNDRSRPEWKLFLEGPLLDPAPLHQGLERGTYLAVECTGFARSESLGVHLPEGRGRDAGGFLSFDAAQDAGKAQLDFEPRPFEYAIDLPVARYTWSIEPDDLPTPRKAVGPAYPARPASPEREPGILPYLVDRVNQTQAIRDSVLDPPRDRRGRPAVFFLEGDLDQAHGRLIQRLCDHDLPEWLALRAEEAGVEEVTVQLPRPGVSAFDQSLRRSWDCSSTYAATATRRGPTWPAGSANAAYRPSSRRRSTPPTGTKTARSGSKRSSARGRPAPTCPRAARR